jgi:hypothetical protein
MGQLLWPVLDIHGLVFQSLRDDAKSGRERAEPWDMRSIIDHQTIIGDRKIQFVLTSMGMIQFNLASMMGQGIWNGNSYKWICT